MMTMTGTASTGTQQLMQVLVSKRSTSLPGMIWLYDYFDFDYDYYYFEIDYYVHDDFDTDDMIIIS